MQLKEEYHSLVRRDALRICPSGVAKKVLEVGCGTGATLGYMKQEGMALHVTGLELDPWCADRKCPGLDEYITENSEVYDFKEQYDAILLLDVLEHLQEPFALLKKLVSCMTPNCYVLISIPNIRNFNVLKDLIVKGEWEYQDYGILDKGHLRFFTYKSFLNGIERHVPELRLHEYASNDEQHGFPWNMLFSFPQWKELRVCQHLFRFSLASA